jgi:predicted ATPase
MLAEHHQIIRDGLAAHDGRDMGSQGDGFFAVFSSPSASVAAVIAIQRDLGAHEWPDGEQVRVRMGIHSGEVAETGTGLVGLEVHRAARIAAVAYGGQIVLSAAAATLVQDSLPVAASLRDLGFHRLKDLGRPEQIFQLLVEGLQAEFPPLRSLDNPALAHNLPAQSAAFIGRDREVAEVRRLVESTRLVTLTGAGGSGKTRLALQVAAELLDGSGDGVWLVELAPVTEEGAVASTINEVLGITIQAGRPPLEYLLDALLPQNILVVLDNCEHLIGDCAKVTDAILRRCPRVHMITTSREPLGIGGETIYRVPSLSLPRPDDGDASDSAGAPVSDGSDAVALFMDRAGAQAVEFVLNEETRPLVVSICRRLDGMPLAIELAAARLRSLSLTTLHERLDQRFRLLTGGSRSALPRQQTLRATVEWSHSLLNEPEKSLLRRLSVFAEGFDLEAAEAVGSLGDIEVFEVTDLLGSLVDKSLVVAEPTGGVVRYRLLETIRQFGAERLVELDESEVAAVRSAHCTHFLSVAELAQSGLTGSDQGRWLARLDAEQANVRRAMEHSAGGTEGTATVLRFAAALRRYWWERSRFEECASFVWPVLERQDAQEDPALLCAATISAAMAARPVNVAHARELGERAVEMARELNDPRLLIESLNILSAILYFAGQAETAYPLGQEAVERARLLNDDVVLGESLLCFLMCSQRLVPAQTVVLLTEAIACTQRSGDRFCASVLLNNAGVYALREGDVPAARSYLEQCMESRQVIGGALHWVTVNLGWVLRAEGDSEGAGSMFEQGLRTARRTGDRSGMGYSHLGMACVAGDRGDAYCGAVYHGTAQAFIDQTGEVWQEPEESYRQASLDGIRQGLGNEQFQKAFAEGRKIPTPRIA